MKIYQLSKQKNIRDLGGLISNDGRRIKYGLLFRGGALNKVNEEDKKILKSFHLTDIVDFRSKDEFMTRPDVYLDNVKYHNLKTFEHELKDEQKQQEDGNLLWFVNESDTGYQHLVRTYKELVDTEEGQEAYRNLFKILQTEGNPVVYYHCSQGKDRVGIASYLIESALGVDMEQIKEDYLLSNAAMLEKKDRLVDSVKDCPFYNETFHKNLLEVFSANLDYLNAAIEVINKKYGGVENYLEKILKVDLAKFKDRYLE